MFDVILTLLVLIRWKLD